MKKRYKELSLSTKISTVFCLVSLVVIITFAVILYFYFQETVVDSLKSMVDTTVSANTKELENLLDRIESASNLVHDNRLVYSEEGESLSAISALVTVHDPEIIKSETPALIREHAEALKLFNDYFATCFGEDTDYSNFYIVDERWPLHVYLSKNFNLNTGSGFVSNHRARYQPWYRETEAMDGACFWFLDEASGRLCMARKLEYRHMVSEWELREEDLGVLLVSFDVSTVSEHLDLQGLTPASEVLILNEDDTVLYSNNTQKIGLSEPRILNTMAQGVTQETRYDGRLSFVRWQDLPMNLRIITVVPVDDIHHMSSQIVRIIVVLAVAMICVAVFSTVFLGRTISAPLKDFAKHMEESTAKPYDYDDSRKDELGTLYRSFNHLLQQLDASNKRTLEAELHALQAQINPHFIYNTLNAISCKAMLSKQEDLAELIGNLTRIIRYNISTREKMVSVAEELAIIHQYENIQKNCRRDRVEFEYALAPALQDILIPKLMIQPLVENALVHSVNFGDRNIHVKLSGQLQGDFFEIRVWDNGREADVSRINRYITGQLVHMRNSLGVRNVYERMGIVYGPEASLVYCKDENGHTVARIRIPVCNITRKKGDLQK